MIELDIKDIWEKLGTINGTTYEEELLDEIEEGIVIFTAILYLFLNWLYKCAAKTMLCLTNNEVYLEMHAPFVKNETSI